jgi:hypothetical protein
MRMKAVKGINQKKGKTAKEDHYSAKGINSKYSRKPKLKSDKQGKITQFQPMSS